MLSFGVKIVVDTNVFVSAVLSADGAARQIFRLCLRGELRPLMGNALISEYEDVSSRSSIFEASPIDASMRRELLEAFLGSCIWTNIYYLWRPNSRDEADNHVIELAVAGGADAIITANKRDFARSELLFPRLKIATAAELLRERKMQ